MAKKLVLENSKGQTIRVFPWSSPRKVYVVHRKDNRRVEVIGSVESYRKKKIKFDIVQELTSQEIEQTVLVNGLGQLRLLDDESIKPQLSLESHHSLDSTDKIGLLLSLFLFFFIGVTVNKMQVINPEEEVVIEEKKKREIVKIVRKKLKIPKVKRTTVKLSQKVTSKTTVSKKVGLKRRGALGILGQLSKSKQKGGLDLGKMQTTAGPGLGGNAGSGGVQTSIYAKGLVAAPLGAGGNIKGGGGYGTKGKGGGKAGFGTPSLVGSAGTSTLPIPRDARVDGGLSQDLIAEVVRRNIGQVRFCYEQGLQLNPSLAGRVAVNWTIGSNGGVKTAQVKRTSLKDQSVENCILSRLKTWKFPLPENKAEVKVSYPFLLKRTGRG